MKILFTCVGRRVELIQAFRSAAELLKIDLKIIGTDISTLAPALFFCDEQCVVPMVNSESYLPSLFAICQKEGIDCLIPTIDTDLLLLAENKIRFEQLGTKVLISSPEKIKISRNKNLTADYFISLGLKSPKAVDSIAEYHAAFPAFIKPKDGSSSINAYKVRTPQELQFWGNKLQNYIIQPFISGKEFTIDAFCDYIGNPVLITPRERIAVRSGEVLKTKIHQDDIIIKEMQTLLQDFRPSGPITVQLIRDELSGDNYYIEINPRFGGGAPLSMRAGADSAKAVLQMLNGKALSYIPYAARDREIYCRFDQSICVETGIARDKNKIYS